MEFRRLNKKDFDLFFENRLRALAQAPTAFLTTLEEEKSRGQTHFVETLANEGDDRVIFGAVTESAVVGTVGIGRENRAKTCHKAAIWGMFVDLDYRGKGISGKLLDLALHFAIAKMRVTTVLLSVESQNVIARRLYESRGFICWGTEPRAMRSENQYFDEDHMVLTF